MSFDDKPVDNQAYQQNNNEIYIQGLSSEWLLNASDVEADEDICIFNFLKECDSGDKIMVDGEELARS